MQRVVARAVHLVRLKAAWWADRSAPHWDQLTVEMSVAHMVLKMGVPEVGVTEKTLA